MISETDDRQATAEEVRIVARAAGLELDAERAGALVRICNALAEADWRLRALPMAESAAAGSPWGRAGRDD